MINTGVSRGSIASSIPFSARYVRPSNLEAFWNMENDPNDEQLDSGVNGIELVYQQTGAGQLAALTTGKIGNAIAFNAPNNPTVMDLGGRYYSSTYGPDILSNFTLSVWLRTRNFSSYSHVIGAPFDNGLYIGSNDTQQTFNLYNGTAFGITAPLVAANTWVHYVFRRSGNNLILNVNGVTQPSIISVSGQTFPNNQVFSVGGGENSEYYYDGDIDALGIWNDTLSIGEVQALYNSGRGAQYS